MGSHLLQGMARSGRYRYVIALLGDSVGGGGAAGVAPGDLAQIADATLDAAIRGLDLAKGDGGLAYCVHLLVQVTRAAREPDFLPALDRIGVPTPAAISGLPDVPVITDPSDYTVYDLTSGFTDAVDRELRSTGGRTDVGEMAQLSAAESLSALAGERSETLFGSTTSSVQTALRSLSTEVGFGRLAHDFFARFIRRFIEYHLSRELSNHVGVNRRFGDVDAHNDFLVQLDEHCRICAGVMRPFAAQWYSKHNHLDDMSPQTAKRFAAHALDKVRGALAHQEGRRAE